MNMRSEVSYRPLPRVGQRLPLLDQVLAIAGQGGLQLQLTCTMTDISAVFLDESLCQLVQPIKVVT